MLQLSRILNRTTQHCDTVIALLENLDIRFTRSYLNKELLEHPNYPSLASIADTLGISYSVACLPLQIKSQFILLEPEINPPFIAHINTSKNEKLFVTVTKFCSESVELYNPGTRKVEALSFKDFDEIYLGTILIARGSENSSEKGYDENRKLEKRNSLVANLIALTLPILTILVSLIIYFVYPTTIIPVAFSILTLFGCIVCSLLLWHEIDQYNPFLKQICQSGKKINCNAILSSKASKIFGLSWSSIGSIYFFGMLVALLTNGINSPPMLQLLSWLNIMVLPYIFFSIYYQWKIAKQWCVLCLMIQGILAVQFFLGFLGGFHTIMGLKQIPTYTYISFISCFSLLFVFMIFLMPALEQAKLTRQKTVQLQRLKHNPQIFEALLKKQKVVATPPNDLGISIGNNNGIIQLIKVCNPYCGPCASAHPITEELLDNNEELGMQIIFTATESEQDFRKPPVAHLLGINSEKNKNNTEEALKRWYDQKVKDYTKFAAQFPLKADIELQNKGIRAMHEWCKKAEIAFTPTFFLCMDINDDNGRFYQLPEMYTIKDLKYFLSV